MSINNPVAFARSHPDWGSIFPQGTLPNPKWRLSDMDGWGERNGEFLFVEWKGPGVPVDWSSGQGLALMRLSKNDHCHVLVLWGVAPDGPVHEYQRLGTDEHPVPVTGGEHVECYIELYD